MKKLNAKAIFLVLASAAVISCNNESSKPGDKPADKKEANSSSQNEKPSGETTTVTALKELVQKDWKAVDGKEFTVKAYPVGMQKAKNEGEFYLFMGDKSGDMSANFAGVFKDELKDEMKKHKGDAMMTISGTLGTPNGMVVLKNAKVVE